MGIVKPYTIKGKIICSIIWFLCWILSFFKGKKWQYAREFEENPRTMTWKDIIYFAYKYYYFSPIDTPDEWIKNHFKTTETSTPIQNPDLSISIGGDLMPYKVLNQTSCQNLWNEIGNDFFSSDIVFANLETPIDINQKKGYVPEVMLNDMYFNADDNMFQIFNGNQQYKGFDILSVANNHSLDMGQQGLINTLQFLESKNIKHTGAKIDCKNDGFEIIEKNNIKVGFLSYTYSLNQLTIPTNAPCLVNLLPLNTPNCDISSIQSDVKKCKEKGAEFIVCALHCGNAYQAYPSKNTIQLFEKLFTACGIDCIAGGHPHNLQPHKTYNFKDPFTGKPKKGFAIYSLGDFVAYDIYTACQKTAYLKLNLKKTELNAIEFHIEVVPIELIKKQNTYQFDLLLFVEA